MKLFERRMHIAKPWLAVSLVFTALAALSYVSGEAVLLRGHTGTTRRFVKEEDPSGFALVAGSYVVLAAGGAFFARYQFRRGSWLNPL